MTIKGNQLKQDVKWREISPDIQVHGYLRDKKEFDSAIWYEYTSNDSIKGIMLLPYQGKDWTEDKLWFPSQLNMNKFCMLCKCNIIMEMD